MLSKGVGLSEQSVVPKMVHCFEFFNMMNTVTKKGLQLVVLTVQRDLNEEQS